MSRAPPSYQLCLQLDDDGRCRLQGPEDWIALALAAKAGVLYAALGDSATPGAVARRAITLTTAESELALPIAPCLLQASPSEIQLLEPAPLFERARTATASLEWPTPTTTTVPAPAAPAPEAPPKKPSGPPPLDGRTVRFDSETALSSELKKNLQNGGLLVASSGLPLRSRHRLQFAIGDRLLGVEADADVVFAANGTVGFSLTDPRRLTEALTAVLMPVPAVSTSPSQDLALDSIDIAQDAIRSANHAVTAGQPGMSPFSGTLTAPLELRELLAFPAHRVHEASELGSLPLLSLLDFIFDHRWQGRLILRHDEQRYVLYCHRGSIAYTECTPADAHSLGRVLVNSRKISEAAFRDTLTVSQRDGRPLGQALVLAGHVSRKDLAATLRQQIHLRVRDCLAWSGGHFDWAEWQSPPGSTDLVLAKGQSVIGHYFRQHLERFSYSDIMSALKAEANVPLETTPMLESQISALRLTPKELRYLQTGVDGQRSLVEALTGSPLGRLATARLIAVGLASGVLQLAQSAPLRTQRKRDASAIRRRAETKIHQLRSANYFEALGLHWSAHPRTYRRAYEAAKSKLKAEFSDAGEDEGGTSYRAQADALLDTAYETLSDRNQRSAYRRQLFDATDREYKADMLVKQGEVALMRGDRIQAVELLETAVELDPSSRNRGLLIAARESAR